MEQGNRKAQYLIAAAVSLSTATIGVSSGWPTPVIPKLHNNQTSMHFNEQQISWMVALNTPGFVIGSLATSYISDTYGRRSTLLSSALPIAIGTMIVAFFMEAWLLSVTRLMWGLGTGMISTVVNIYMAEITDKDIRARLTVMTKFMFNFGNLLVIVIGYYVSYNTLNYMMLVLPICYASACWFTPETPYYYLKEGKVADAKRVLSKLRKYKNDKDYLDDFLVFSKDEEEHKHHLRQLFTRLREYGMVINTSKCVFGATEVKFLGYLISADGTKPLPSKVEAIQNFPVPKTIRELYYIIVVVHSGSKELEDALTLMQQDVKNEMRRSSSFKELIVGKQYRKAVIISIGLRIGMVMTGQITTRNYLGRIMQESKSKISLETVFIIFGAVNFLVGVMSSILVDRVGRRPLLVYSFLGTGLSLALTVGYFFCQEILRIDEQYLSPYGVIPFIGIVLSTIISGLGYNSIIFTIGAEIFPLNVKSIAMTSLSVLNGILGFGVAKGYQEIKNVSGLFGVFFIFTTVAFASAIFSYYVVPETKGKSLKEIQIILQGDMYTEDEKLNHVVTENINEEEPGEMTELKVFEKKE